MTFETQAVAVTGVTPRANVILFAIDREPVPYDISVRNHTMALSADARGAVRFELKAPLTPRAIVAVVDEVTGHYAIETPAPAPLRIRALPADTFRKRDGEYLFADLDHTWIEAICVRPGRGAWRMFVTDGAQLDADGLSDGRTVMAASALKRLSGADASPVKFNRHDVMIVIDPRTMTAMVTEVPE